MLPDNNSNPIQVKSSLENPQDNFSANAIKDVFLKYLHHLPFILFCVIMAYGIGYIVIRYADPVYSAETQFLVKIPELNATSKSVTNSDLIEEALNENKKLNLEVEITRLKSIKFLKRVVEKGHFQLKIRNLGRFRSTTLFQESPVRIGNFFLADSSSYFNLYIDKIENNRIYFTPGKNPSGVPATATLGQIITTKEGNRISLLNASPGQTVNFLFPMEVSYTPSVDVARQIAGKLAVSQQGKTSVINLVLRGDNPIIAREFLDLLVYEYQMLDIESKRKASSDAVVFINDRLKEVEVEIEDLNDQLMSIKKRNKFLDIQEGASYRSKQVEGLYFKKIDLDTEREIIKMLRNYLNDKSNSRRKVPILFGLEDSYLNKAVSEYNKVQLDFERDLEQFSGLDSNRFVRDYEKQLSELRYNIMEILVNLEKQVKVKENVLLSNEQYHLDELNKVPELQKEYETINSLLVIKKGLYTYLIQRKEQIGITSSSVQTGYESIDKAQTSSIPVEPKVTNIRNFAILSGLIFGIVVIYLLELFNDKIISREQLQKRLKLPIAGEIAHTDQADRFVFKKSRSLIAEQFRMVRANLPYLLKTEDTHKVILITSTIPGEGKSFVSSNLAASLSLVNKKTALLLFDLRKINSVPAINELMEQTRLQRGITNYLIGQVENPDQIHLEHPEFPNLHVFPSGPIPPNPAELLLNPKVKELFDYLRSAYDYVIVDTAPSALVSDCFILQDYADITLYLIRQRYTLLKQMDYIREIAETGRLKNMTLLVNDVVAGGRYGYYGYTYTYGYGYTYNYNYTYQTRYGANDYYTESIKLSWLNKLIGFTMKLLRNRK